MKNGLPNDAEREKGALLDTQDEAKLFHARKVGELELCLHDQDPVNIKAAELVGKLHDASGYTGHDLERFLVRLVFCLFADDTGVFEPRGVFLNFLEERTREDGSDLGGWLTKLFEVLDTPDEKRDKNLDGDLGQFPYVNGDLFKGATRIPDFNAKMRTALIDASRFDWSPSVRKFAKYPALFTQDRQPDADYLALPRVSSERREYIPIAILKKRIIAHEKLLIIPSPPDWLFALLTSAMHMGMRTVSGRLESRYSYAPAVYNSFQTRRCWLNREKRSWTPAKRIRDQRLSFSTIQRRCP